MTSDANQPGGIPGSPDGDDGPTILVPGGQEYHVPDGTFGPDGNHKGTDPKETEAGMIPSIRGSDPLFRPGSQAGTAARHL
ncbi:MAG: hypothetical protein ACLVJO_09805 [[Clostridium] scindens]